MSRPERACRLKHLDPREFVSECGLCRFSVQHPGFYNGDTEWAHMPPVVYTRPTQVVRTEAIPEEGPGTELKKILADMGIQPKASCSCTKRAIQMDQWGVDGCRKNLEQILEWVRDEWVKLEWMERVKLGYRAVLKGLGISADPIRSVVEEAIRRAEAKRSAQ